MNSPLNKLLIAGIVLVILGIVGLAIPVFVTQQTKDVAEIGDLTIQTQEKTSHVIAPAVAGSALVIGIALMGVGAVRKRL